MARRLNNRLILATCIALSACGGGTPPPPVVELAAGADTVSTGYAEIADAAWLGDGRFAVVAPMDVTVGLVDLGRREVTPLGGSGTKDLETRPRRSSAPTPYTSATGDFGGPRSGPSPASWLGPSRMWTRHAEPCHGRATRRATSTSSSPRDQDPTAAAIAV
jgi:hypothetical protein